MTLIRLAHLVWELSVSVAAYVVCLSSFCPTSDLGNYTRCARNFVTLYEIGVGQQDYDVRFCIGGS